MVKQADLDSKNRDERDIKYLLEKRERLLQTLLLLMGLMVASPIYDSNAIPDAYYLMLFVFIIATVFLYSEWVISKSSPVLASFLETIIASSCSFSFIFPFALTNIASSNLIFVEISFGFMTVAILSSIHVKNVNVWKAGFSDYLMLFLLAIIVISINIIGIVPLISN